MPKYVARYYFNGDHHLDEVFEARDEKDAFGQVAQRLNPNTGYSPAIDKSGETHIIAKGAALHVRIRTLERDEAEAMISSF